MWIKLLRNTVADAQLVSVGQVLNVRDETGLTLVRMGKATAWTDPLEPPKPIEPAAEVVKEPIAPVSDASPSAPVVVAEPVAAPPPPSGRGKGNKGKGGK